MHSLLPRLFLALFACSAVVACDEEGPEGDDTTETASGTEGDETGTTGSATAGVTQGSLAMPPGDDSEGDESTTGDDGEDTRGPGTTLAPPKFE